MGAADIDRSGLGVEVDGLHVLRGAEQSIGEIGGSVGGEGGGGGAVGRKGGGRGAGEVGGPVVGAPIGAGGAFPVIGNAAGGRRRGGLQTDGLQLGDGQLGVVDSHVVDLAGVATVPVGAIAQIERRGAPESDRSGRGV